MNDDNSSNARARGAGEPGEEAGRGAGGNKHPSGRVAGLLAGLKRMLFRAPNAKSDLNMEMLEELHMVTGCKFIRSPRWTPFHPTLFVASSHIRDAVDSATAVQRRCICNARPCHNETRVPPGGMILTLLSCGNHNPYALFHSNERLLPPETTETPENASICPGGILLRIQTRMRSTDDGNLTCLAVDIRCATTGNKNQRQRVLAFIVGVFGKFHGALRQHVSPSQTSLLFVIENSRMQRIHAIKRKRYL